MQKTYVLLYVAVWEKSRNFAAAGRHKQPTAIMPKTNSLFRAGGVSYAMPFALVTFCFALWGFANDITNPMVEAFSRIFRMGTAEGSLVQLAFYGGYFAMAFPAAMFIRRFSYKRGVLMGLALYAIGALLFFPAKAIGQFPVFLVAYFILTCGLSFLETSCNPYILSMGSEETATRRLNLAQCFNPVGSICGMTVAMVFIQANLHDATAYATATDAEWQALREADLTTLIAPYLAIGAVIIVMFLLILIKRMPTNGDKNTAIDFLPTLRRIFALPRYREGVVAQFFYVGAQIMCWTFIIQYGIRLFTTDASALGDPLMSLARRILAVLHPASAARIDAEAGAGGPLSAASAATISQMVNIIAMTVHCCGRFVCTWLLKYISPGRLLMGLAIGGGLSVGGVIVSTGIGGMYCLVAVSGFMSVMFPTIYGIALNHLGDDAKFGAAGLIMSILGGSVLTPVQGSIIDIGADGSTFLGLPWVNVSFVLPLLCFCVIAAYGYRRLRAGARA